MIKFLIKNSQNLLILIFTLVVISSIGIDPGYLLKITESIKSTYSGHSYENEMNFYNFQIISYINLIRGYGPILLIIIILVLLIFEKKKLNIINLPLLIFFLYNIFQIIGFFSVSADELMQRHFVDFNPRDNFKALYLSIQSISFCFLLFYVNSKEKKEFENYLKFLFISILLVYFYFLIINLSHFFSTVVSVNMYATDYNVNKSLLIQSVPRSSGMSRILLIVILALLLYGMTKKFSSKVTFLLHLVLISLLISFIYLFNSRLIIISLLFFSIFAAVFFFEKKKIIRNLINIIIIILTSTVLVFIIIGSKNKFFLNNQLEKHFNQDGNVKIYFNQINYFDNTEIFARLQNRGEMNSVSRIKKDYYPILFENQKLTFIEKIDNFISFYDYNYQVRASRLNSILSIRSAVNAILEIKKKGKKIYKSTSVRIIDLKDIDRVGSVPDHNAFPKEATEVNNGIVRIKDGIYRDEEKAILFQIVDNKIIKLQKIQVIENDCKYLNTKLNRLLTGRLCHWYVLLGEMKLSIFGKGPQFDRTVIKWGASNSLVYAYVCAGIFGVLFYIYFASYSLFAVIRAIRLKTSNLKTKIIAVLLAFFLLRSGFEVSIAYWSVDQLLFISIVVYFYKFRNEKNL